MRYIRTKDNKIIDLSINHTADEYENIQMYYDNKYGIIKQADIIEELCDCYSYDVETTRDFAVARSWKLHHLERMIYGCIKTDKGLIYVAKMNNGGELCLL